MKRTISFFIAALMSIAIVAIPALAASTVSLIDPLSGSFSRGDVPIRWSYSGFHPSAQIAVEAAPDGTNFISIATVNIDDGTPGNYGSTSWSTGTWPDSASYVLRVRVIVNSQAQSSIPMTIDNTAPVVTGAGRTAPNASGWNNEDVAVTWICNDATSGVVAPTVDSSVTSEGAGQTATSACTDRAGNVTPTSAGGINIDKTSPILLVNALPAVGLGPVDRITGTLADSLSGTSGVSVTFRNTVLGTSVIRSSTCSSCAGAWSWEVPTEGLLPGHYEVSVDGTDIADNVSSFTGSLLIL